MRPADRPKEVRLGEITLAGTRGVPGAPVIERLTAHSGCFTAQRGRESLGLSGSHPPQTGHCPNSLTQKAVARLSNSRSVAQPKVLPTQLGQLGPLAGRHSLALAAVDARLAHPIAQIRRPDPKLRATDATERPSSSTNDTASALNSAVNDLRDRPGANTGPARCFSIVDMATS